MLKNNQQLEIVEDLERDFIYYEQNLLRMPLFFINKKDTGTQKILQINFKTATGEGTWKVSPNMEHGAGGPFEDKVLMSIHKILMGQPKPLKNPIDIGPISSIAKIMGIPPSGENLRSIKKSFKRMAGLLITSKIAYYDKSNQKYLNGVEGVFHLIEKVAFVGDEMEGYVADRNLFWMSDIYINNINSRYATLIDIDFYMDIKDTDKALFKLLLTRFFANRNKKEPVTFKYSNICNLTTLKRRTSFSQAKQQLDPTHGSLTTKHFLENYQWENAKGDKKDWYVHYWPGTLAAEYISVNPASLTRRHGFLLDEGGAEGSEEELPIKEPENQDLFKTGNTAEVDEVIDHYKNVFKKEHGNYPFIVAGKEDTIIEEILRQQNGDKQLLKDILTLYVQSKNPEFAKYSYTLTAFQWKFNDLVIDLNKKKKTQESFKSSSAVFSEPREDISDEIRNFTRNFK